MKPTEYQEKIALKLGIDLKNESAFTAAARIEEIIEPTIKFDMNIEYKPATPKQIKYAKSLGINVKNDSQRMASAKIYEKLQEKNTSLINQMRLKPGDKVVRVSHVNIDGEQRILEKQFTISSIGSDNTIYFKGGNGQRAWPTQVKRYDKDA